MTTGQGVHHWKVVGEGSSPQISRDIGTGGAGKEKGDGAGPHAHLCWNLTTLVLHSCPSPSHSQIYLLHLPRPFNIKTHILTGLSDCPGASTNGDLMEKTPETEVPGVQGTSESLPRKDWYPRLWTEDDVRTASQDCFGH